MINKEVFSANMRFYRKKCSFSQELLAEKAEVSTRTIQFLESGSSSPSLSLAIRLSEIFKITLDELLGLYGCTDLSVKKVISEMTESEKEKAIVLAETIAAMFKK